MSSQSPPASTVDSESQPKAGHVHDDSSTSDMLSSQSDAETLQHTSLPVRKPRAFRAVAKETDKVETAASSSGTISSPVEQSQNDHGMSRAPPSSFLTPCSLLASLFTLTGFA